MSEKVMISPLAHTESQPGGESLLCMPQAHIHTHTYKAFMEINCLWAIYIYFFFSILSHAPLWFQINSFLNASFELAVWGIYLCKIIGVPVVRCHFRLIN